MYTYNPDSIMNPQLQLNNYMADKLQERASNGYRQALGNPPSVETRMLGALAGVLAAKLLFDFLDR